MPELEFKLKAVAQILEGGAVAVEALGFPETNSVADSPKRAMEALRSRVRELLSRTAVFQWHQRVAPRSRPVGRKVPSAAPNEPIYYSRIYIYSVLSGPVNEPT